MYNRDMLTFFLLFALWAVVHSATATLGLKGWFRRRFGENAYEGWYRFLYNSFSVITFLPLYLLIPVLMPGELLWAWPRPFNFVAIGLQLLGLLGLGLSLWVTDVWHFLGVRQVVWYLRGAADRLPQPPFTTTGPYTLVRHPLYFFSLVVLWFNPLMSVGSFAFYTAVTVYFWVGSIYEEKKLAAYYGQIYTAYQEKVPRLFPNPLRLKTKRPDT